MLFGWYRPSAKQVTMYRWEAIHFNYVVPHERI